MELLGIIALVFILYLRTLSYNYIIDDNVKRDGYLYEVPETPPPHTFYFTRPSKLYRLFMIAMHCVNVSVVYMLWGWGPALIFAVHPMSVWGTAWVTGNYYATAAYFTLISYFIVHQFPNVLGSLVALPIFAAALNSTICPLTFPFFASIALWPWGLAFFIPLAFFLKGKRFQTGIKIRLDMHKNKYLVDTRPTFKRLFLMVKVVARYTYNAIVPDRLGFFNTVGWGVRDSQKVYDNLHSPNIGFWSSLAVVVSVFTLGMMVHPIGTLWFFSFIALHSQWNMTGQFYAQRYLYLSVIGLCVVAGVLLEPYPILMTAVVTFLILRTHLFIPAFTSQGHMFRNDIDNYPEHYNVYNNYAQWIMSTGGQLDNIKLNQIGYNLFLSEKMSKYEWELQMNLAAFFATIGQWEEALKRTQLAIEILTPLGGSTLPIDNLRKQEENMKKIIAQKNEAVKQQGGATISPPQSERGNSHGQRTGETIEAVLEPVGADCAEGREK